MNYTIVMRFVKNKKFLWFVFIVYALVTSLITSIDYNDFGCYLDAAIKMKSHADIYAPPFVRNLQYYYSPLWAMLLIPATYAIYISKVVFCLFSYFLLYRTFVLLRSYFDFNSNWGGGVKYPVFGQ